MLLKGTLRNWSAADWTADVQIAGSRGSYLNRVPLASAVPVWELVAGRTVLVAVPDERNPGDAYVVGVMGAPAGPPRCRAYRAADQTVASGVITALAFDSERFDSHGMHDPTTNNSRLTCRLDGVYAGVFTVYWQASGTGERWLWFRLNGGATALGVIASPPQASVGAVTIQQCVLPPYRLVAGDYVECVAFQSSGGDLTVKYQPNYSPEVGIWLIGT